MVNVLYEVLDNVVDAGYVVLNGLKTEYFVVPKTPSLLPTLTAPVHKCAKKEKKKKRLRNDVSDTSKI